MRSRCITAITALLLTALWAAGCGSDNAELSSSSDPRGRMRYSNLSDTGLTVTTSDLDQDGEPDQWTYSDAVTGAIVRAERDIDFNGRVDLYEYYDGQGNIIEEEMNLDFDTQVDVVRFYRDNGLVRRELAMGFDGRFSVLKYYDTAGNILRVERDTDLDGTIDMWEFFENGEVVRTGYDQDGDGSPEIMDSLPQPR